MRRFILFFCTFLLSSTLCAQSARVLSGLNTIFNAERMIRQANIHEPNKTTVPSEEKTTETQPETETVQTTQPTTPSHYLQPSKREKKLRRLLKAATTQNSALQKRLKTEQQVYSSPFGIAFFKPTYILPVYFTASPYQRIYQGVTPDNQKVRSMEFKAQISLKVQLLHNFIKYGSLYLGYTQLSYWQFYAKSQYFRETNYEPELFFSAHLLPNWVVNVGVVHQSNGRGGALERSWNRAYVDLMFSGEHWLISLKPWILIFKPQSSDLHNPDIDRYLGYGRIVAAYKYKKVVFSVMLRNMIVSGFSRGAVEGDISFPIHGPLRGYLQVFDGYGQSLIEYDHRTSAVGIGITLSDWI